MNQLFLIITLVNILLTPVLFWMVYYACGRLQKLSKLVKHLESELKCDSLMHKIILHEASRGKVEIL